MLVFIDKTYKCRIFINFSLFIQIFQKSRMLYNQKKLSQPNVKTLLHILHSDNKFPINLLTEVPIQSLLFVITLAFSRDTN